MLRLGCDFLVGVGDGDELVVYEAISWLVQGRVSFDPPCDSPAAILVVPYGDGFGVLEPFGEVWILYDRDGEVVTGSAPPGSRSPAAGTRVARSL